MPNHFTFSDGWLLTTLWGISRPCDRTKLNEMGDIFNHAIFNDDEVEDGMVRLGAAGLAEMLPDGRFHVTPKGTAYVEKHWVKGTGLSKNMFYVAEALQNETSDI